MEVGITRESYLTLCEQIGEEPDLEKMPPEVHNFPLDVQKAMSVFNKLGDKIVADIGYLGKDYTTVQLHMDLENVSNRQLFMETLLRLDGKLITKSAEAMKREREKLKQKKK